MSYKDGWARMGPIGSTDGEAADHERAPPGEVEPQPATGRDVLRSAIEAIQAADARRCTRMAARPGP